MVDLPDAQASKAESARGSWSSGGSIVTKTVNGYGPYRYLVGPPSAGRPWVYLGKANGDSTGESAGEQIGSDQKPPENDQPEAPDGRVELDDLPALEDVDDEYIGWVSADGLIIYMEEGDMAGKMATINDGGDDITAMVEIDGEIIAEETMPEDDWARRQDEWRADVINMHRSGELDHSRGEGGEWPWDSFEEYADERDDWRDPGTQYANDRAIEAANEVERKAQGRDD